MYIKDQCEQNSVKIISNFLCTYIQTNKTGFSNLTVMRICFYIDLRINLISTIPDRILRKSLVKLFVLLAWGTIPQIKFKTVQLTHIA